MMGFASKGGYVTPSMAREGDAVVMSKCAAIEATASLATSFPEFVEKQVGGRAARRARSKVRLCTTVADAKAARAAGVGRPGVTSMHDATEGGTLGALDEMAAASGKMFEVDMREIPVSSESEAVCSAFGLDPLATMGEGALLITCSPGKAGRVARSLSRAGIQARKIGEVKKGTGLSVLDASGGRTRYRPRGDPYWSAYESAVLRGLR